MILRKDKRDRFWDWFHDNAGRLERDFRHAGSPDQIEALVGEVHENLQRYDSRLYPLIGTNPGCPCELIITAEGNADAFNSVFNLIKSAPEVGGWRLIPLKPRFGQFDLIDSVSHDGHELPLHNVRFSLAGKKSPFSLAIIFETLPEEAVDAYRFMAIQMVESLIGEYDLAIRIEEIEFFTLSEFRETAGHDGEPLAELIDALPPLPAY